MTTGTADDPRVMRASTRVSRTSRPPRTLRARLALAARLAALVTFILVTVAPALPGDAVARSVRARVRHAKRQSGYASWYGPGFLHRRTASGEWFDPRGMTAAHPSLPLGTRVRVTNLENGRRVVVRINDRGPFRKGRVLDVTPAVAKRLGFKRDGLTRVRLDVLKRPREALRYAEEEPRGSLPAPRRNSRRKPGAS
jgi:rare lipoprotein A (peptidoglycan hydrolase)